MASAADREAVARLPGGEQREGHQQKRLAEDRERHIDRARSRGLGGVLMSNQPEGGDADEGVDEIEGEEIGGDENAEASDQRQQPADREAGGVGLAAQIRGGIGARPDPQQRADEQQHGAGRVQREAHAKLRQIDVERAAGEGEQRGAERGDRGERQQRDRMPAKAGRQADSQQSQGSRQRQNEQRRPKRSGFAHGAPPAVAPARPIWRKS